MDSLIPKTIDEVEKLVQELYRPGPPQKIAKIQDTLQKLQRSADGWQLADALLGSNDNNVKFFGALTFTVKLNLDSNSLSADDARALLSQLIMWLVRCIDQSVGVLVIRKLCSTLVTYFLKFNQVWEMPVKHLTLCLYLDQTVRLDTVKDAPKTSDLVKGLTLDKATAALWFCTALAEEVGKTDANSIRHHKYHDKLKENVDDVVALLSTGITGNITPFIGVKVRQESMKCLQAWVLYSHRAFIDAEIVLESLKGLTKSALACLVDDEMYEVTVELFSDVLANYSRFLGADDLGLIFSLFNSEWGKNRYNRLIQGDFTFESLQFGQFMIAFGDATVQDLARNSETQSQQFLAALSGLLAADGYAVAEDLIFVPAVEFWATFTEVMIDSLYGDSGRYSNILQPLTTNANSTEHPTAELRLTETKQNVLSDPQKSWFELGQSHIIQAISSCWRKIQYPPPEILDSWDSVDRAGFIDARMDVIDLLQASYTLTGTSLFSLFAEMTLQSLGKADWEELEASLFCLVGLSDCVADDDISDSILESIFNSTLFVSLTDSTSKSPTRARQATLTLIGEYDSFFKLHTAYLPDALTFLFNAITFPVLAVTASKSIHSLCLSCRADLTNQLDPFIQHYKQLSLNDAVESLVKERIAGSIAAIIQAMPTDEDKHMSMVELLHCIESALQKTLQNLANGESEAAETRGLELLRSLASISRDLQAPVDSVVDLTDKNSPAISNTYWIHGAGSVVQIHVQKTINEILKAFPDNGDMIETACNIFRPGFAEKFPGPFVFDPAQIAEFLLRADFRTPRLVAVINTACSLISSQSRSSSDSVDEIPSLLSSWVLAILQNIGDPTNDPEIAQASIDFTHRLLNQYLATFIGLPPLALEQIFIFTLKCMTGSDPLPKAAAAEFWSTFVSMVNLPADVEGRVRSAMEHVGPSLAEALVYNISGNAARSELDKVSDPLKKLVIRQIHAKAWLEDAILGQSFMNNAISESERRIFLQKIMSLRGSKLTNQVVKDFWLACRGSSFAYAS